MESKILEVLRRVVEPLLFPVVLVILFSYSTKLILRFINCRALLKLGGLITLFWAQLLSFSAKINIFSSQELRVTPFWLGTILTGFIIQALANSLYDAVLKHLDRTYVNPHLKSQD